MESSSVLHEGPILYGPTCRTQRAVLSEECLSLWRTRSLRRTRSLFVRENFLRSIFLARFCLLFSSSSWACTRQRARYSAASIVKPCSGLGAGSGEEGAPSLALGVGAIASRAAGASSAAMAGSSSAAAAPPGVCAAKAARNAVSSPITSSSASALAFRAARDPACVRSRQLAKSFALLSRTSLDSCCWRKRSLRTGPILESLMASAVTVAVWRESRISKSSGVSDWSGKLRILASRFA
mmetsp:Transcript_86141/g.252059  ORF Transcript_86141/g.252059 Transcript_86141/m.252059 type:complete len:239 (-) Transcript_86141:106-822(-)